MRRCVRLPLVLCERCQMELPWIERLRANAAFSRGAERGAGGDLKPVREVNFRGSAVAGSSASARAAMYAAGLEVGRRARRGEPIDLAAEREVALERWWADQVDKVEVVDRVFDSAEFDDADADVLEDSEVQSDVEDDASVDEAEADDADQDEARDDVDAADLGPDDGDYF